MKYQVIYKVYDTTEEIEEARLDLEAYNNENPQYPALPLVTEMDTTMYANDEADLKEKLLEQYGVKASRIISINTLGDDSNEPVRDLELIALADQQPTCAHYDWTTDEVLAFARAAIEAHCNKVAGTKW